MPEAASTQPDLGRLKIDRTKRRTTSPWGIAPKLLVLALVAIAAWFWWTNKNTDQPKNSAGTDGPRLIVADYESAGGADGVSGNGYVIARRRAALSTVLSGRLVEIHVEEGTKVTKGQIVARIQYDDFDNSLTEAKAMLAAAQSKETEIKARAGAAGKRVAQAQAAVKVNEARIATTRTDLAEAIRNRERNRKSFLEKDLSEALWDELVTKVERQEKQLAVDLAESERIAATVTTAIADLEAIKSEIVTQKAEIDRALTQVNAATILLEKTYIRAPFGGVIVDKGAEEGEVVAATGAGGNSRGSVATLVDLDTLEVQVELPEVRLAGIAEGQQTEIYLDIQRKKAWAGHIRQIWPAADRGKGTVEIRIVFDDRPALLRPEMGARVVFLRQKKGPEQAEKLIAIPRSATFLSGNKTCVWIVDAGILHKREVVLGSERGTTATVLKGLEIGEQLVDRPTSKMKEGMRFPDE